MDTSVHGTRRGTIDAGDLADYLRQRITQLEADAVIAARHAAEELRPERPDYSGAHLKLRQAARLAERAAELRRVLQDHAL